MFRLIKNLFMLVAAIVIIVLGMAFNSTNSQTIAVDLLVYKLPAIQSGLLVISCILIGFVLAFLTGILRAARLRVRNAMLARKVESLQQHIDSLRQKNKMVAIEKTHQQIAPAEQES